MDNLSSQNQSQPQSHRTASEPGPAGDDRAAEQVNRRRYDRFPLMVQGKLLGQGSAKFLSAHTVDVSEGGALIEVDRADALTVGESIGLGLDTEARSLIPLDRIVSAVVVRVRGRRAAVRFIEPQALPDAVGPVLTAA